MDIKEAREYLENNSAELLAGGASGAKVYDIAGKYVLKCVSRAELGEDGRYASYRKEALWYQYAGGRKDDPRLAFLPEVCDIYETGEEIFILMKCYQKILRSELDTGLMKKIMEALAAVHTAKIPDFLVREEGRQNKEKQEERQEEKANLLLEEQVKEYVSGWQSVLDEHPGSFSSAPLKEIAEKINHIIRWHAQEKEVLNHGDFHFDNLLLDKRGNVLICDWQGVSVGAASGDLSFFFSRLGADGLNTDIGRAVSFYVQEFKRLSGKALIPEVICRHMDAADVITSFVFWHEYLHGSDVGRVRGIYEKMVDISQNFCEF